MTTRHSDSTSENPLERWQRWHRDRAREHGSNFPPAGVNIDDRAGTLKNWVTVLNRNLAPGETPVSHSTVRGWLVKPSPAACLRIAHALGIPEQDVFAIAYGTDERAEDLASRPAIDPDAQLLNELLSNPRLPEDYKDTVRGLVRGVAKVAPPPGNENGGGKSRATG